MSSNILSRRNRNREQYGDRLPPGQKVVEDWPVLTYGGIPRVELSDWRLRGYGLVEREAELSWEEFSSLSSKAMRCDVHCITSWSRMDNEFEGVPFTAFADLVSPLPEASAVMVHCYGGYTTNVLLDDLMRDDVLLAYKHDGKDLEAEHGGPCQLVVPHLYFWKSAKWVRAIEFIDKDRPGFWEQYGYHLRGDPWKEERYS